MFAAAGKKQGSSVLYFGSNRDEAKKLAGGFDPKGGFAMRKKREQRAVRLGWLIPLPPFPP